MLILLVARVSLGNDRSTIVASPLAGQADRAGLGDDRRSW